MFKNVAGQFVEVLAIDTATNKPKTGDAANITVYIIKDHGTATALTDTSATEVDATNAKGLYRFDVSQSETNCDMATFTGKSSTSGIEIIPVTFLMRPANATALSIDSSGRVDVIKVNGTSQTARDLGGQLDATISSRMATYTQPTGFLAATFPATVASTTNITAATGVTLAAVTHTGATIPTVTNVGTLTTYTGNTPQTGDAYARLGAPAGASVSADVAAVKTDTGNLLSRITSTLFSGITQLSKWLGALAGKTADASTLTEINATTAGAGYNNTTDSQEALRDRGDAAWITATSVAIAAGGITSSSLATDAISAASVSAAAVTKIQSGLSTYAGGDTAGTTTLLSRITATRAGYIDNLSGGAVMLASSYTAPPTAATISTQVQTDLGTGASLTALASQSSVNTLTAYVDTEVAAILDAVTSSGVVLSAAQMNKIADHVLRRNMANVEASSSGDTLSLSSQYGTIQQAQESSLSGVTLTVKKTDGSTTLGTKTVTTSSSADPITGIS